MKTYIWWKKIEIKQGWMELFKVEMNWKIEEVWLDFSIELAQEKNSIVDNIFDKIAIECSKYPVSINWRVLQPQQLALMVTNIYYTAIEELTKEWKNAFVCYIDESKDKLRERFNKTYNVEEKKVIYKVTNKDLLNFIKERNGEVWDEEPTEDIYSVMNTKLDTILTKLREEPRQIQVRQWDEWTKETWDTTEHKEQVKVVPQKKQWKTKSQFTFWWVTLDAWI